MIQWSSGSSIDDIKLEETIGPHRASLIFVPCPCRQAEVALLNVFFLFFKSLFST
jgi:hypothetical protein